MKCYNMQRIEDLIAQELKNQNAEKCIWRIVWFDNVVRDLGTSFRNTPDIECKTCDGHQYQKNCYQKM